MYFLLCACCSCKTSNTLGSATAIWCCLEAFSCPFTFLPLFTASLVQRPAPTRLLGRRIFNMLGPWVFRRSRSLSPSSHSVAVLALCRIAAGCVCLGPHAAIAEDRRPPVAILGLSWAIFVWGCLGCLGFATAIWGCLEAFSRPLHIPFVRCFTIPTPLVHCFIGLKASPYPLADRVGGFASCWALWYFAVLALCAALSAGGLGSWQFQVRIFFEKAEEARPNTCRIVADAGIGRYRRLACFLAPGLAVAVERGIEQNHLAMARIPEPG